MSPRSGHRGVYFTERASTAALALGGFALPSRGAASVAAGQRRSLSPRSVHRGVRSFRFTEKHAESACRMHMWRVRDLRQPPRHQHYPKARHDSHSIAFSRADAIGPQPIEFDLRTQWGPLCSVRWIRHCSHTEGTAHASLRTAAVCAKHTEYHKTVMRCPWRIHGSAPRRWRSAALPPGIGAPLDRRGPDVSTYSCCTLIA